MCRRQHLADQIIIFQFAFGQHKGVLPAGEWWCGVDAAFQQDRGSVGHFDENRLIANQTNHDIVEVKRIFSKHGFKTDTSDAVQAILDISNEVLAGRHYVSSRLSVSPANSLHFRIILYIKTALVSPQRAAGVSHDGGASAAQPAPPILNWLYALFLATVLTGCASGPPGGETPGLSPAEAHAVIERSLPAGVSDRPGWTRDIYDGLSVQNIAPSHEDICAVVAVIDQESGFKVNPTVPGLPTIAWREIDRRAASAGIPLILVHTALKLTSATGASFGERIDAATTEKDLSDIYEDFIGTVPLGRQLFADHNPVHTRGPMQVNVAFAKKFAAAQPYPYAVHGSIGDELFTRRGGIYFGVAHLLGYAPTYHNYLYRFADFNAGQYASRNAAFQAALSKASGMPLTPDGALLAHDAFAREAGRTEAAARAIAKRLDLSDGAIHGALEAAKSADFERSALYQRVFVLADRIAGRQLPRAVVPRIELKGPKITHRLTTAWYAHRVDARFKQCLER